MRRIAFSLFAVVLAFGLIPGSYAPALADDETHCEMKFTMKGWSAFYKTAKGEGTITCDNGESADVTLKLKGGGITFGKSETRDGVGKFSPVNKLSNVLGTYGGAQAEAGAVKSTEAQAFTKGNVSLAIRGTGGGWNLGVSGAKFTITRN